MRKFRLYYLREPANGLRWMDQSCDLYGEKEPLWDILASQLFLLGYTDTGDIPAEDFAVEIRITKNEDTAWALEQEWWKREEAAQPGGKG